MDEPREEDKDVGKKDEVPQQVTYKAHNQQVFNTCNVYNGQGNTFESQKKDKEPNNKQIHKKRQMNEDEKSKEEAGTPYQSKKRDAVEDEEKEESEEDSNIDSCSEPEEPEYIPKKRKKTEDERYFGAKNFKLDMKVQGKAECKRFIHSLILANAGHLVNDISQVDYIPTAYKERRMELELASHLFADTMIWYAVLSPRYVNSCHNCGSFVDNGKAKMLISAVKEAFALRGVEIDDIVCQLPVQISSKCESAELLLEFFEKTEQGQIAKQRILESTKLMNSDIEIRTIKDLYFVGIKVGLSGTPYQKLNQEIQAVGERLKAENILPGNVDVTIDCAGTVCKEDLAEYFRIVEEYAVPKEKMLIEKTYRVDDTNVGKNCFTYVKRMKAMLVRCKFYNKFVCTLTQGQSVQKKFGNHLKDLISNSNNVSGTAYQKEIQKHGYTRFECTFYCFDAINLEMFAMWHEEELNRINKARNNYGQELFIDCPLAEQWKQLEKELTKNMAVFDLTNKVCYAAYWVNSETERITGTASSKNNQLSKSKERDMLFNRLCKHHISLFSFPDLPMHCLYVDFEGKVTIRYECWMKKSGTAYHEELKEQAIDFRDIQVPESCNFAFGTPYSFTFAGGSNCTFQKGIYKSPNCFTISKTKIQFMIQEKTMNCKSALWYAVLPCPELEIEPIMELNEKQKRHQARVEMIEEGEKARKELSEVNEPPESEDEKEKLKIYHELEELRNRKLKPLQSIAVKFASKPSSLLKETVLEWSVVNFRSFTPAEIQEYKANIVAIRICSKADGEILGGRLLTDEGKVHKVDNFIIWAISTKNKQYFNQHSLKTIKSETINNNWKYYGVPPGYTEPIFNFKVFGCKMDCHGYNRVTYRDFQFAPGWNKMPLINCNLASGTPYQALVPIDLIEKIKIAKEDLKQSGENVMNKNYFVWNPEIEVFKDKECKKCDDIPKGSLVMINELYGCRKGKGGKYKFKFRGSVNKEIPEFKGFKNAPFVCNSYLNEVLSCRLDELQTRTKALTMISKGKGFSKQRNQESKWEVQF